MLWQSLQESQQGISLLQTLGKSGKFIAIPELSAIANFGARVLDPSSWGVQVCVGSEVPVWCSIVAGSMPRRRLAQIVCNLPWYVRTNQVCGFLDLVRDGG